MKPHAWQERLRDEGLPALLEVRDGLSAPWAVSVPTGGGKTFGVALLLRALFDAGEMPGRVVVATSRRLLVADIQRQLRTLFPEDMIGEWTGTGSRKTRGRRIVVTTYASLGKVIAAGGVDLLVCDEAHWSGAESFSAAVRSVPWRIGVSATLYRGDGGSVEGFERVLFRVPWDEAEANGWIVPYRRIVLETATLARVRVGVDDSEDIRALHAALAMIEDAGGWKALGPGVFTAPDGATAEEMARIATESGLPAEAIGYRDSEGEYERKVAALRSGEIGALITVALLTEGVDFPWLRWVALTAALSSDVKLMQFVGRSVRALRFEAFPDQERYGPKVEALVFDPANQLDPSRMARPVKLGWGGLELKALPRTAKPRAAACFARLDKLPEAVAVEPLGVWAMALRDFAVRAGGADWVALGEVRVLVGAERDLPAQDLWKPRLKRLMFGPTGKGGGIKRVYPANQREALRLWWDRWEGGQTYTRGVVADIGVFIRWCHAQQVSAARLAGGLRDFREKTRIFSAHNVELPADLAMPGEMADEVRERANEPDDGGEE